MAHDILRSESGKNLGDSMQYDAIWSHYQGEAVAVFDRANERLEWLLRLAAKRFSRPSVLNSGVGNGYLERSARDRGWEVSALDPDPSAISRLLAMGVSAKVGRAESLPFNANSVDVVFASEVLEHLDDAALSQAIPEIARVLRSGGVFLGTVPFNENLDANVVVCPCCAAKFHRWGHQKSFTAERIRSVLSRSLIVEFCRPVCIPLWKSLNSKGKLIHAAQIALSKIGIHGSSENLVFVAAKR